MSSRIRSLPRSIYLAWTVAWFVIGPGGCSRPVDPEQPASSTAEATPQSSVEQALTEVCQLIARRLELMPGVAQAKWNRKLPITDEKRERELLTRLVAEGEARNLPTDLVRDCFQAQITAAKLIQEQSFREWTAQQHPPFENPPDLEDLRPQIDEINGKLLDGLAKCWHERAAEGWTAAFDRARQTSFQSKQWGDAVIAAATKPLKDISLIGK